MGGKGEERHSEKRGAQVRVNQGQVQGTRRREGAKSSVKPKPVKLIDRIKCSAGRLALGVGRVKLEQASLGKTGEEEMGRVGEEREARSAKP